MQAGGAADGDCQRDPDRDRVGFLLIHVERSRCHQLISRRVPRKTGGLLCKTQKLVLIGVCHDFDQVSGPGCSNCVKVADTARLVCRESWRRPSGIYQISFKPNWMRRGLAAEEILPKVGEPRKWSGKSKFVWFSTLNNSDRNWTLRLSLILEFLITDKLTSLYPGASRMFLPELPKLP